LTTYGSSWRRSINLIIYSDTFGSSLEDVLHDARDVDPVEVVVPVDGLGVEVECHAFLRRHCQAELLHVHVVEASFYVCQEIDNKSKRK
jgi:hypothetical protein